MDTPELQELVDAPRERRALANFGRGFLAS